MLHNFSAPTTCVLLQWQWMEIQLRCSSSHKWHETCSVLTSLSFNTHTYTHHYRQCVCCCWPSCAAVVCSDCSPKSLTPAVSIRRNVAFRARWKILFRNGMCAGTRSLGNLARHTAADGQTRAQKGFFKMINMTDNDWCVLISND